MFLADVFGTFVNVLLVALGTGVVIMLQRTFTKMFWELLRKDAVDFFWGSSSASLRVSLYVLSNVLAVLLTAWTIALSWWVF